MRRTRNTLGLLFLMLVGIQGCALTDNDVKPPRPQEEFKAPPDTDPRYSRPIEYPKETMDQDALLKRQKDALKSTPGPISSPRSPTPRGPGGY
jgi:hypothetical protein